jgi:hypothetical protein
MSGKGEFAMVARLRTLAAGFAGAALALAPAAAQDSYLEDRVKIEDLMARYIFALDWRDAEGYAATFTEDGVLNYGGGQAVGREAIAAMVQTIRDRETEAAATAAAEAQAAVEAAAQAAAEAAETADDEAEAADAEPLRAPHTQHFVTNIVLDIDGSEATSWAYWVAMSNNNPERAARVSSYGHYVDTLRKVDGEWLFTSRRTYNEQVAGREGPDLSPIMGID